MPIPQLPASQIAATVNRTLLTHQRLVITAPPGAGKSTLLPLTILDGIPTAQGKIIVLEPRRIAARQIAMRMAAMIGEPVGKTVGYRVRFENKVSDATRIEVVTEGILTRMLVQDATLDGVAVVIFDEFHERNIHSDVALALVREAQSVIRPDLRIVVMSATIDADAICRNLAAPLVESKGRMYPVEIVRAVSQQHDIADVAQVVDCIRQAHADHEGDILVFLPGQADIQRCQELLGTSLGTTVVCPLYGNLPIAEQHRAIMPSPDGSRKVVLATNIAETSLTIEGVRIVIDTGLCRTLVYDARNGLSHLETVRISMDMATQRSGRAGRVADGICYRLWTLATEHRMAECRTPEILDADLTPMVLDIAAWQGIASLDTVMQMQWMTPPPKLRTIKALQLLASLGALDADGRITTHGKRLAALPCHPRIAQMLVMAATPEQRALAADIAALLEEKDPLLSAADCDINLRIATLREHRRRRQLRQWERIERVAAQYRRMVGVDADNDMPDPLLTGALIACAYPERVARNVSLNRYRLAGGEEVSLPLTDALLSSQWLAIASMTTGTVFLASAVDATNLTRIISERDNISWNSKQGCVVAQRERRIGQLVIDTKPLHNIPKDDITAIICEAARKDGRSMFSFDDRVQNLQQRVATVAQWHPELQLPDLSTDAVLANGSLWIPYYIYKATTVAELRKIDLTEALWSLLTYDQQLAVDRLAPTHLQVPTGSRIRVEYRLGAQLPVLRVRLQECFGLTDTPTVDDGCRRVLMELLSPGFKPVQLTQDLSSFWQTTYFEVRKEMRRRYPKHYWPDNPLEAEPTRGRRRE